METLAPIILPSYDRATLYPNKKRLSSSQFLKYEENPCLFYTDYVIGVHRESSPAMVIGSIFSAVYADRDFPYIRALDTLVPVGKSRPHIARAKERFAKALAIFPPINPEYPLIAEFNGWEFRASLDDVFLDTHTIIENKTGETEWTQERTNFSEQITFQAWAYWKKYGIIPRKIMLNWVDLRSTPSASSLPVTFKTSRSISALQQFENRIKYVIENIDAGNFTNQIY